MLLTIVFFGGFFWDGLNVHTFHCHHRTDRRVEGLVAGWVGLRNGWMGCRYVRYGRIGGYKEKVRGEYSGRYL